MNKASQSGFTLMEVLIAVLVLSVGLLGLAGLQARSLRENHSAMLRSQATILAYGMADRMRANYESATVHFSDGYYNNPTPANNTACYTSGSTSCTSQVLAAYDVYQWQAELAKYLPNGQGVICIDSTPDDGTSASNPKCDGSATGGVDLYAIKVWWTDSRNPNVTNGTKMFVMSIRP